MLEINTVFVDFTTACNLKCPNCCCGIPHRAPVHYPWEYFERLASFVYGIDRIDVTGGEPTCHPKFGEYIPKFRALFGCCLLTLETNCFRTQEYPDVLRCFDWIRISEYPTNHEEVEWLKANHPHAWRQNRGDCVETSDPLDENAHVSIKRRGSGSRCTVEDPRHVIYADGKLYPCRLGLAVEGAVGIELSECWREEIERVPVPCSSCYFSPDASRTGVLSV